MYTDGMPPRTARRAPDAAPCPCGCGKRAETCIPDSRWGIKGYPLAGVYAPLQEFTELYSPDAALKAGTLFKQLDLPFMGSSCPKGGGCRG